MTQQARERDLSRRGLIVAGIGVAALAPAIVRAQTPPRRSGDTGQRDHQPAARLRPERCADGLWPRSRHHHHRSGLRRPHPGQYRHRAPVDGRAVVGGTGLELGRQVPGVERHPEQPATALARGRRPGERVPLAVEQQQRQHLRLPGPADLLRAPDAPRRALRARRLDDRAGRQLQRQAAELAQRRGAASRRQRLVHRSAVRRPALRGHARRAGRAEQRRRAG